ncbi:dephospho-CoA kinase [Leucobacter denitrificans]|uniref:Dephospho-CoA kinase n=1 Tax=Leucobacter denitrificans TaxID=683042 RepID=A0A7G9S604_9MICO|nr:dephospho-CoA kinase [Leucobacter denitrificans]QNN63279.1 dephospho-CoA kinase [Leucobacter denitrificans]
MQLIALTGGIASGKSTIGKKLEELGAVRIDADQLAREAVEPGSPGLELITQRFGGDVLSENGELNRAALGTIVFNDTEALNDLNTIVHPEVRRLLVTGIDRARQNDLDSVVVYEVPLLVEAGIENASEDLNFDAVVVADAPAELRVQRMIQLRGMSEDEARQRIANQASDEARRAIADVLIDTSGTEDHTIHQVEELWQQLTRQS